MYRQFFMNITELLKTESIYSSDDIVEKIQTYMQHNYQQNLTQDFISSLFFLNRNYLSTLFKLKTYLFRTPLVENDILSFKLNVILLITKCEILNFFSILIASITINTYMN